MNIFDLFSINSSLVFKPSDAVMRHHRCMMHESTHTSTSIPSDKVNTPLSTSNASILPVTASPSASTIRTDRLRKCCVIRKESRDVSSMSIASQFTRRIQPQATTLFLCDIQSRFRDLIHAFPSVTSTAQKMLRAASILDLPVLVTEQNPRALGNTIPELDTELAQVSRVSKSEKMRFSMWTPEVQQQAYGTQSAILFGIEAHVCVLQTCLELLDAGMDVHVLADGVSSMNPPEIDIALTRMRDAGAVITTSDSILFQILQDASHPKFREISKLVKEFSESTKQNQLLFNSRARI